MLGARVCLYQSNVALRPVCFPDCVASTAHVPSCVCLPSAVSVTRYCDYKHCKYQAAVVLGLPQKHCGEKLLWSHESIILIGKILSP